MTRARPAPRRPRPAALVALGAAALVVVAVVILGRPGGTPASTSPVAAAGGGAGSATASGSSSTGAQVPASRTPGPSAAAASSAGPAASGTTAASRAPAAQASGSAPSSPAAPASALASPAAPASAAPSTAPVAPSSAAGFDPRRTVVSMAFPLPSSARYRYGAAWRVPRLGVVYPYNQIRGVTPGGTLLRAHDGVDLEVAIGTLVVAPFAGVVVDPATIWKPWDPQRYGKVVVVRSTEATSRGYYAILVHLSRQSVGIGQVVRRGQVVGRTGSSGNAAETVPHLHFELRAPFPIEFHYAGVKRLLDDFDPLPSLRAADPKLRR